MLRFTWILIALALLTACAPQQPQMGPDGKPLPTLYRITDAAKVQFRMLDGINALRQARGAAPLSLSAELTAAAKTHAQDMSFQNRPWHFGSDGSNPLNRAARAGYSGEVVGENISETFESELETLSAWMQVPDQREIMLNPQARDMGFAWHQEPDGKIWWTLVIGRPGALPRSFPS